MVADVHRFGERELVESYGRRIEQILKDIDETQSSVLELQLRRSATILTKCADMWRELIAAVHALVGKNDDNVTAILTLNTDLVSSFLTIENSKQSKEPCSDMTSVALVSSAQAI